MTPFMLAVQAVLDGHPTRAPATEPSRRRSVAQAAHTHVNIRALAEQLVSEANSVLRERGDGIGLFDEPGPDELTFTLRYRERAARLRMVRSGHTAIGELVTGGETLDEAHELTSADELRALVLCLLSQVPGGHDGAI